MRHKLRGRQMSRDSELRKTLRRNLVQSLFENGKVRTTLPKAKEVRAMAEKLITVARVGLAAGDSGPEKRLLNARRKVISILRDRRLTDQEQEFILNDKGNPIT